MPSIRPLAKAGVGAEPFRECNEHAWLTGAALHPCHRHVAMVTPLGVQVIRFESIAMPPLSQGSKVAAFGSPEPGEVATSMKPAQSSGKVGEKVVFFGVPGLRLGLC